MANSTQIATIKQSLINANWSVREQEQLATLLPASGPLTALYVENIVSFDDSANLSQGVLKVLEIYNSLLKNIRLQNNQELRSFLYLLPVKKSLVNGQMVLPVLHDLLIYIAKNKIQLEPDVVSTMIGFVWRYVNDLPYSAVGELLQYYTVTIASSVDFQSELQRYVFLHTTVYNPAEADWGSGWLRDIEQNNQLLSDSGRMILIKNETVPATLSNWLKDYAISTMNDGLTGGGYALVQYQNTGKNFKTLSQSEQAILLSILQAYNWLQTCELPEIGMEGYDAQRREWYYDQDQLLRNEIAEQSLTSLQPTAKASIVTPFTPVPTFTQPKFTPPADNPKTENPAGEDLKRNLQSAPKITIPTESTSVKQDPESDAQEAYQRLMNQRRTTSSRADNIQSALQNQLNKNAGLRLGNLNQNQSQSTDLGQRRGVIDRKLAELRTRQARSQQDNKNTVVV